MLSKWRWKLLEFSRRLWVRATLFGVLGGAAALLALVIDDMPIFGDIPPIGADAVEHILSILASSMLAVTTFSLGVLVSAYSSVSGGVTPRATRLLMQDSVSQNALATFLGSFLYSMVGIVALSSGAYGERGRTVLFFLTLLVIVLIVLTLLRWIDYLNQLGRLGETTTRVESAAEQALERRAELPALGCRPLTDAREQISERAAAISHTEVGYVEHIDLDQLQAMASKSGRDFYITAVPGAFIHPARSIGYFEGELDDGVLDAIRGAFSVKAQRNFDQDPRFGLVVLSEIASRALSPAVNDPGTAIDIIGRLVRLLVKFNGRCESARQSDGVKLKYDRLWAAPLELSDLLEDAFTPIARDGASLVEVHIRLMKAYEALYHLLGSSAKDTVLRHARTTLDRAEAALSIEADKVRLRQVAQRLMSRATSAGGTQS